jgi:hydroxymethylpyrimidine pyrophosphatase-like HAD family hydrolase
MSTPGIDAVQRVAHPVTLSNEEDGLAAAIERYVLAG